MKSAYQSVTHWVRFHSRMVWEEIQIGNVGWVGPAASIFMHSPRPLPDVPEDLLFLNEEVTSVLWLLNQEHDALLGRVKELFGLHNLLDLPTEVTSLTQRSLSPEASLSAMRNSVAARVRLIAENEDRVDAHTRLLLRKHQTILTQLILPTLDTVIRKSAGAPLLVLSREHAEFTGVVPTEAELAAQYRHFLPDGPRPHPDTFLTAALLERAH